MNEHIPDYWQEVARTERRPHRARKIIVIALASLGVLLVAVLILAALVPHTQPKQTQTATHQSDLPYCPGNTPVNYAFGSPGQTIEDHTHSSQWYRKAAQAWIDGFKGDTLDQETAGFDARNVTVTSATATPCKFDEETNFITVHIDRVSLAVTVAHPTQSTLKSIAFMLDEPGWANEYGLNNNEPTDLVFYARGSTHALAQASMAHGSRNTPETAWDDNSGHFLTPLPA